MDIKKKERKYMYPLLLVVPVIFTIVFISDKSPTQNEWIKWAILCLTWLVAFALIIWAEVGIRSGKRKKK